MSASEKNQSRNMYQHYADVRIDLNCSESDVYSIIQKIHPEWSKDEVVIKRLEGKGGFINGMRHAKSSLMS